MNIFQQYGIKEVADVTLYSIELDENDDEVYVPVLYLDTLKVSTITESASDTSAEGGLGNPKLITWDYGKEITVNLEDALFTPASQRMMWGKEFNAKKLTLYLRNFYDRGTDSKNPNANLRGAILSIETFSDFLIIPDRWPTYEMKGHQKDTRTTGYVGGTSIYCWMVNGNIISNDNKKRVAIKNLILFFREQTQKWYFFNGGGPVGGRGTQYAYATSYENDGDNYFHYKHQYGEEVFEWIRTNLSGNNSSKMENYKEQGTEDFDYNYNDNQYYPAVYSGDEEQSGDTELPSGIGTYNKDIEDSTSKTTRWTEYEDVAKQTILDWGEDPPCSKYGRGPIYNVMAGDVGFLTQTLYIDGYRTDKCARNLKYSNLTEEEEEEIAEGYEPYRYLSSVDVVYNSNICPPQDAIYSIDNSCEQVTYFDRMEECKASSRFCIDTDVNILHSNYRYMNKYNETELTVFINPKTMSPYEPNSCEYYRQNGQRITGNLYIFKQYEKYLKWTRTKAYEGTTIGEQITIDAQHFPGTYRLVGETYCRSRKTGKDQRYQFEIPLCKMGTENELTLQADGDPTTFSMTLTAMRRYDGVMMKLTQYDVVEKKYGKKKSGSTEIVPFSTTQEISPSKLEKQNIIWTENINSSSETDFVNLTITQPEDETIFYIDENTTELYKGTFDDPTTDGNALYIKVSGEEQITTTDIYTYSLATGNEEIVTENTIEISKETKEKGLSADEYEANLINKED